MSTSPIESRGFAYWREQEAGEKLHEGGGGGGAGSPVGGGGGGAEFGGGGDALEAVACPP